MSNISLHLSLPLSFDPNSNDNGRGNLTINVTYL